MGSSKSGVISAIDELDGPTTMPKTIMSGSKSMEPIIVVPENSGHQPSIPNSPQPSSESPSGPSS